LRDFNSNPGQIIARASEPPKFSDLLIVDLLRRAFDSHHDPFLVGTGPDDGVWKRVVKCDQNRFRFVDVELINRQPECRDATVSESIAHQREKLFGIKIYRPEHFWRRRFAGYDVVALRTGLQKEPAVLNNRSNARITQ